MKKLFAIALALVMVLGIATSAMAITWAAPTVSASSTAPFSAEVIKLNANAGVTGYEYYSIVTNAAAYNYSNLFYAIKLNIPSAAQANAAYAGANYSVGDTIKVNITYTNVSGKTSETKVVSIGASPKTLWYNGKTGVFEESWVPSVSNACGCGDQHVIRAMASGTGEVKVRVCFSATGKLSDIKLAGCYGVDSVSYLGIKPCANCVPTDVKGYKFSGECAKFPVFFSTNSAGKVLGAYVIDNCGTGYTQDAYGSMQKIDKTLYGWDFAEQPNVCDCPGACTDGTAWKFVLTPLSAGRAITDWNTWTNDNFSRHGGSISDTRMRELFAGSCGVIGSTVYTTYDGNTTVPAATLKAQYDTVYMKSNNDIGFVAVGAVNAAAPATQKAYNLEKIKSGLSTARNLYRDKKATEDATNTVAIAKYGAAHLLKDYINVGTMSAVETSASGWLLASKDVSPVRFVGKDWSKYASTTAGMGVHYTNQTYYFGYDASPEQLFAQIAVDRVNCDTNDAAYLNSLNHLYSLLGFTYADILAGNVYMNDNLILANFGFAIAPCAEATWGAYTAAITVAPIAEVPATGSATFMGFLFIGLSAVATVLNRKRSSAK